MKKYDTLTIYISDSLPGDTLTEKTRYAIAIACVPLEAEPTPEATQFAERFTLVYAEPKNTELGLEYKVRIRSEVVAIDAYRRRLRELE